MPLKRALTILMLLAYVAVFVVTIGGQLTNPLSSAQLSAQVLPTATATATQTKATFTPTATGCPPLPICPPLNTPTATATPTAQPTPGPTGNLKITPRTLNFGMVGANEGMGKIRVLTLKNTGTSNI